MAYDKKLADRVGTLLKGKQLVAEKGTSQILFYFLDKSFNLNIPFAHNEPRGGGRMKNKAQGIVMLAAGSVLLYWGYSISQSISSKVSQAMNGGMPDKAIIIMVLGGLCAAFGFFKLFKIR